MSFEKLVNENLGLVHTCCNRFRSRASDYEELYCVGCLGLVKAAKKFDIQKGYKFSTYAVPVILGEIKMYFRDSNPIKFSRATKSLSLKVKGVLEEEQKRSGKTLTPTQIAKKLNVSAEEVALSLESTKQIFSLESDALKNTLCREGLEKTETRLLIRGALERMDEQQKQIILLRFFSDKTQTQTAKILNITQVQVSRAEKRALQRLKELLSG